MHLTRLAVALVALPVFYFSVTRLSPVFFLLLLAVVSVIGQIEFCTMYRAKKDIALWGTISGVLMLGSLYLTQYPAVRISGPGMTVVFFMLSFMLMASARLFLVSDPSFSLKDLAPAVVGFLYIPNLLSAQWYLRLQGHEWIIFLYGCVWASDSLAYYIGKGTGRRKLYVEVSPNKTWEGAAGSLVGGMLSGLLLGSLLLKYEAPSKLLLFGAVIGSVTIAGDLVESMFKRDAGVKDSGSIVPGHGGILDKIDGVLFAGPVLYWMRLVL